MSDLILPPSVFSETHSPKMSDKYVHIKTSDILERFRDMGWNVASVNAPRHSKAPEFARHALRLRHRDFPSLDKDSVIPELIVLNSHNGSWALRIALGMFRVVCSNGMVAGSLWDGIALKHYNIKDLEEKVETVTGRMGGLANSLADKITEWQQVEVPFKEQEEFARKAIEIRWGDKIPVTPENLLLARRDADKGNSLWKVYNRVQENLTQGGYSGISSNGRTLNIKPVKNVKRDYKFNHALFDLAATTAEELQ